MHFTCRLECQGVSEGTATSVLYELDTASPGDRDAVAAPLWRTFTEPGAPELHSQPEPAPETMPKQPLENKTIPRFLQPR